MDKIKWQFKENAEPVVTDGFWYDMFEGGYICADKVLDNEWQINRIKQAVEDLRSFRDALDKAELIEYM